MLIFWGLWYLVYLHIMSLLHFHSRFPTEDACLEHFMNIRIEQGVTCTRCGRNTTRLLTERMASQWTAYGCSIPLTKGTVMKHSKLSPNIWFDTRTPWHLSSKNFQPRGGQHQSGKFQYHPICMMMTRLRNIMGRRETTCHLSGEAGLDKAFRPHWLVYWITT